MTSSVQAQQYLIIKVDSCYYGIPVVDIRETLSITGITELPQSAGVVRGLLNVRGQILTVVDSRRLFGLQESISPNDSMRLVVIRGRERPFGITTDSIPTVMTVNGERSRLEAGVVSGRELVTGADGQTLIRLLDTAWIFSRLDEAGTYADLGNGGGVDGYALEYGAAEELEKQTVDCQLLVPFRASDMDCAVPASMVACIRPMPEQLVQLHGTPPYIRGMMKINDELVTVLDTGMMLGGGRQGAASRVIVVELEWNDKPVKVGLVVEHAERIARVPIARLQSLPSMVRTTEMDWITGLYECEGIMTYVLDVNKWNGWDAVDRAIIVVSEIGKPEEVSEVAAGHSWSLPALTAQDQTDELYLFFEFGPQMYGIRAAEIREILREWEVTPLPDMPDEILGLVNIRGNLVTTIDLAARLGESAGTKAGRLIVTQAAGQAVAFPVDEIRHLRRLKPDELKRIRGWDRLRDDGPSTGLGDDMVEWSPGHLAYLLPSAIWTV